MRRLVTWLLLGCALMALPLSAEAEKKKASRKARAKGAPQSEQIAKDLGKLHWGMSEKQVMSYFTREIEQRYGKLIREAHAATKEDKLRAKERDELAKVRQSLVHFDGETTGWDVSFLQGEFTHNNGEALLVVEDNNSKNFFFFIQNKLWKWYKAFDAKVFRGKDFAKFTSAVEGRYGESLVHEDASAPGGKWLEWQDKTTRLRGVDLSKFYGFYSLVFEDKATLGRLDQLRRNKARDRADTHSVVQHVTDRETAPGDTNHDAVDRITGRVRADAPPPRKNSGGSRAAAAPAPSGPAVSPDNDPLGGL